MSVILKGLASVRDAQRDVVLMARLARDLGPYLRTRPSIPEIHASIVDRLANRTERFLQGVDRTIFGGHPSPFRALLRTAGCERGDVHALVRAEGIEGALTTLRDRGVYVTYDEAKGRRPFVRGSTRLHFTPSQFVNPLVKPHIARFTSGTGGRPSRADNSLAYIAEQTLSIGAMYDAHGIHRPVYITWATVPIVNFLICTGVGMDIDQWYLSSARLPWRARLGIVALRGIGRMRGWNLPAPSYLDPGAVDTMVDILRRASRSGRPIVFKAVASTAARVGIAASRAGVRLDGVTAQVDSEPITPHRRSLMERPGMGVIVGYGSVETPTIAYSCVSPAAPDDVHVFTDRYAVITRRRPASETGPDVDALLVTTLSDHAPMIALNVETGDDATVVERPPSCCSLGALGMTTHLEYIRSFEKLTGEGTSFARSALVPILEEILPTRFGGTGLDYQMAEVQGADGTTRLVLRVDPSLGVIDEERLKATLLASLERDGIVARFHADLWRQAGTVQIVRERPKATPAGKVFSMQIERAAR